MFVISFEKKFKMYTYMFVVLKGLKIKCHIVIYTWCKLVSLDLEDQ